MAANSELRVLMVGLRTGERAVLLNLLPQLKDPRHSSPQGGPAGRGTCTYRKALLKTCLGHSSLLGRKGAGDGTHSQGCREETPVLLTLARHCFISVCFPFSSFKVNMVVKLSTSSA